MTAIGHSGLIDEDSHARAHVRDDHARRRRRSLRDVQIAARHADPRTTVRYDRARKILTGTPTSSPPT
jgi:hypothetical protein